MNGNIAKRTILNMYIKRLVHIYFIIIDFFYNFFVTLELSVQPLAGPSGGQADVK